nr:hypothetical protein [Tanacetum cinerariifolium]
MKKIKMHIRGVVCSGGFICGLPWEIGNNVRLFKPNNLSAAYLLAVLEEVSYNLKKKISHQPLLSSTKLNESNEEEKESKGLLVVDDDCKKTELRVSGMDVDNELVDNVTVLETVEESFAAENRLVDNVRCDKAELKASEMDDNSNSKEVEKESIESVGYEECFEENVNVKGKEIEYVNLILLDEPWEENVEGLGIETKESVDNNKYLETTDKFVKGNDVNKREITRGNKIAAQRIGISLSFQATNDPPKFVNHAVESNDLGKENGFDDLSLVEMTTMLEKSKGPEVKNIRKRHGLGIVGYGDSLFPILGLDGLGRHNGADEIELQSLNQILHRVTPNSNVMTTYPSGTITSSFGQSSTKGMEFKIEMNDLNKKFVHLAEAKKDGDGPCHLKLDIWKWPERKKLAGTKCKIKHGKWKFDIWKWPKRKRKGKMSRLFCWNEDMCIMILQWLDEYGSVITESLDVKVVTLTQFLQLWVSKVVFDSHVGLVQQVMAEVCSLVGNHKLQWIKSEGYEELKSLMLSDSCFLIDKGLKEIKKMDS